MAKYIRYTGTSHVRQITDKEWVGVGVQDQETVTWNRANNFLVPLKDISDAAWPFIDADSELVVEDHAVRDKADQPEPEDLGPENLTGYLATLREEDAADTGEEVVVVDAAVPDQQSGSVDVKATTKAKQK